MGSAQRPRFCPCGKPSLYQHHVRNEGTDEERCEECCGGLHDDRNDFCQQCTDEIFDDAAQSLGYANWEDFRASDEFIPLIPIPTNRTGTEMLRQLLGEADN